MPTENSRYATSLSLLQGMQAGNNDGWDKFVHLYTPLIYFWCRQARLQEADAADVCQEVFQAVARGIDGLAYDQPSHSFRGWLWTITRRTLSRHFKRISDSANASGGTDAHRVMHQVPDWIDDEQVPESASGEAEVIRRATELIRDDFEDKTWQAFWLAAVEGLQASDIGERLDMTPNNVRQAKFRVMSRLKEFVGFV